MAHEILSFKVIKPFLGSSIYVWTSVLTAALFGLAMGYILGAKLSKKSSSMHIFSILFVAGLLLISLPFYSSLILDSTVHMDIKTGILLGSILIISPIMLLLGMFSPLMVQLINANNRNNGQSAGSIYSVSTLGGIAFSLACTLVTIPIIGIKLSYALIGLILILCSITSLMVLKKTLDEK